MKIKSVTATWLHVPIPEQQQHTSDFGPTRSFDSTLVRVEAEGGRGAPQPLRQARLRVVVDQQRPPAHVGQRAGQVVARRGLADAPLLVQRGDDGHEASPP